MPLMALNGEKEVNGIQSQATALHNFGTFRAYVLLLFFFL